MTTLHTINKSPFEHNTLSSCLRVCIEGDGVLLIEDGVYGALDASPCAQELNSLRERGIPVFALEPDAQARGLARKLASHIKLMDYDGFVRLSTEHQTLQSWY